MSTSDNPERRLVGLGDVRRLVLLPGLDGTGAMFEPFAGAVTVDAGRGLLLASDVIVDRDLVWFDLLALGTASPGDRTLVLDDGDRLWEAHIDIDEYFEPLATRNMIIASSFETDQRLNLSGVPINNSATLTLQSTTTEAAPHTFYVFLEYVAVATSFLTNVEVKI